MYSCHLFLLSSASVRSIPFLSFIGPIFVWNVPLVSQIFLNISLVFPILWFSSISLHWSLRKASYLFLLFFGTLHSNRCIFPFLLLASLLFLAICKAASNNHFAFLQFFFLGMVWSPPPVQCYELPTIVLQALCLSDLILWIYLSLPLYNCKGFICPSSHLNSKLLSHIFFISALHDRHSKACIIEDGDEMMGVVKTRTEINRFFSYLHFTVGLGRTLMSPLESASVSFANS